VVIVHATVAAASISGVAPQRSRRDFEANHKRLKARWRAEDERRERRRRFIRRLFPFRRAA
jgi:hypothetical protein